MRYGVQLATASTDATVRLWDLSAFVPNEHALALHKPAPNKAVRVLREHRGDVRCVAFGPKGDLLISGGADTAIRLWDPTTGEPLQVLRSYNHTIWALGVSGDGKTLTSGGASGVVHLWDLRDPRHVQVMRALHGYVQPIFALAVHPDGHLLPQVKTMGGCVCRA